jgi:hypothetical protein
MSIETITSPRTSVARELDEEKDNAELASKEGFTGTLADFLDWLDRALVYGFIHVHEESLNQFGRPVIKIETVTGGYSSDEHLLGNVEHSVQFGSYWASKHKGGLVTYEFPVDLLSSNDEVTWLAPDSTDGLFETVYRVRRVRFYDERGDYTELNYDSAAELLFQEPDRDINEPAGLLIVRPGRSVLSF